MFIQVINITAHRTFFSKNSSTYSLFTGFRIRPLRQMVGGFDKQKFSVGVACTNDESRDFT
jgi:hypothetical protein